MRWKNVAVVAAVAAAPAALLQVAPAAADSPRTDVLRLHVAPLEDVDTGAGFVAANRDLTQDGHVVGYDVTTCRSESNGPACDVGLGLARGLLLITFTPGDGDTFTGVVTGGTGTYAHAKGSVLIHETSDGADATITLR
jgi:hypothetical protein